MNEQEIAHQQAMILFDRAFRFQQRGDLANAMILYQRSLEVQPTAEAHTYLGWTYSMLGRLDEAIEECYQAIAVDPTYGNPYNDIGVYHIEKEAYAEAIPWLQKALIAPRYEAPQFPRFNLGRVYQKLGDYVEALRWYNAALEVDPLFLPAEWAKTLLLGRLN